MRIGHKNRWENASHDAGEAPLVEPRRRATQRRLLALALLAGALSTAGCGGSSGTPSASSKASTTPAPSSTSQPSRTGPSFTGTQPSRPSTTPRKSPVLNAFAAKANGICARRNAELSSNAGKSVNLSEVGGLVIRRAAIERRALNQLDLLTPPAEAAGNWRRLLGEIRTLIEQTVQLGKYSKANNVKGVQAVATASAGTIRELAAEAHAAGVDKCSLIA